MVMNRIANALSLPSLRMAPVEMESWREDPVAVYHLVRAYYDSLDLYNLMQRIHMERGTWAPAMKGIRNPCARVVEFYVAHLGLGDLEIITESERIKEPIQTVWKWSNWDAKSKLAARWFARDGDLFLKVVSSQERGRVYFQLLDAATVLDFDRDERGFLTYVHIEVPRVRRERDGKTTDFIHTEIWDQERGDYRRWERDQHVAVDRLGPPLETVPLSAFGIDFVPIVHAQFKDVGNDRGVNAYLHALDKIDEANRQATRLHQMLFKHNNVTWALSANAMDNSGRPLPPPRIEGQTDGTGADPNTVTLGDETLLRLPGMSKMEGLVPPINYGDALAILNAQLEEIERDLPELAFHRLRSMGEISGKAARMIMADAIDKILEARNNAEQALVRADQMALTMGAAIGLPEFRGLGTFEAGDFDHEFEPRDPIGLSEDEKWETERVKGEAAKLAQETGVSVDQTLRERGYSDEEIAQMKAEREDQEQGAMERALNEFDRGTA